MNIYLVTRVKAITGIPENSVVISNYSAVIPDFSSCIFI